MATSIIASPTLNVLVAKGMDEWSDNCRLYVDVKEDEDRGCIIVVCINVEVFIQPLCSLI